MSRLESIHTRMNIRTLVWPIFVEQLMRMSMMSIDVFMLTQYSESAVAAVGLTGYFIFFLMLSYSIVSSGGAVLIGQSLGAHNEHAAQQYSQNSLLLALFFSVIVGVVFVFGSPPFINLYGLAPEVAKYATQYAVITGGLSIGMSLSILFSTILRAYGYTKSPMIIQLIAGIINLAGNYLALFAPFGLPQSGVVGVALATAVSQIVSALLCWHLIKRYQIPCSFKAIFTPDYTKLKKIMAIGLPNAGEGMSYNMSQITVMYFIAQLGTVALAAAAIVQTIARFMFVFSMSLGMGAQVLSSFYVGQGRYEELKSKVHLYWIVGMLSSICVTLLIIASRTYLAGVFSNDIDTQQLIGAVLIAALFLESGRAINLIVIAALKGAGDVIFPVWVGVVSMWGIGVLFAYLLGNYWAFGLVGIWIATGLDEWVRGIIMLFRWQRGRWTTKSVVLPERAIKE